MYINCLCPHCAGECRVEEQYAGTLVHCPHCGAEVEAVGARPVGTVRVHRAPLPTTGHRPHFECPFCHSDAPPIVRTRVSTAGWVVFVLLFILCVGPWFAWIGLFIREDYRVCSHCGIRLG